LVNSDISELNENHIILSFHDFDYSPEVISNKLNIVPSDSGIKGEEYFIGKDNKVKKDRKANMWRFEWNLRTNDFIGDIIEKYIEEIIIPRVETIREISLTSEVEFSIVQYYYDGCNPGVYIKKKHTKILAEINSSINIDIYCLGR
jgi:hypothetical protein